MNGIDKLKVCLFVAVALFLNIFFGINYVFSQSSSLNKYGLLVIKDTNILQQEIDRNPSKRMVDLHKTIPNLTLDLKYASTDNFMHKKLYPATQTTFLRKPAADALKNVVNDLKKMNLGIKIFDAYRPYSVTEKMWEKVKDNRYAADPAQGSGHNRGISVDLTLIDLVTKKELPMPTGFDNFSDTAHEDFMDLPMPIIKNREILKSVMGNNGFIALSTEWWHFYLPDANSYELLDLPFAELEKMEKERKK
ncbi:MAG TPA: M15 family metallopeptidase [Hanamia sp.]|nr:M15 family metallopeptidase [Hanamia sp.]